MIKLATPLTTPHIPHLRPWVHHILEDDFAMTVTTKSKTGLMHVYHAV